MVVFNGKAVVHLNYLVLEALINKAGRCDHWESRQVENHLVLWSVEGPCLEYGQSIIALKVGAMDCHYASSDGNVAMILLHLCFCTSLRLINSFNICTLLSLNNIV